MSKNNLLPFSLSAVPDAQINRQAGESILVQFDDGEIEYFPDFFSPETANRFLHSFCSVKNKNWQDMNWQQWEKEQLKKIKFEHIQWEHNQIRLFGKQIYEPRFSAWYGDANRRYTYSGETRIPNPWNKRLLAIKKKAEEATKEKFNSVLLNWYRNGEDSMGWHADDEKELGLNPTIASVSFGAERDFQLRRKENKQHKLSISLHNGSLLIMRGGIQAHWKHALPKRRGVKKSRVNLTFRKIHTG